MVTEKQEQLGQLLQRAKELGWDIGKICQEASQYIEFTPDEIRQEQQRQNDFWLNVIAHKHDITAETLVQFEFDNGSNVKAITYLNYPILITLEYLDQLGVTSVFSEFLGMPLGSMKPEAHPMNLLHNEVLFEALNGSFIISANYFTCKEDDKEYISLYVDPDFLLSSINGMQVAQYTEAMTKFEKDLLELREKIPTEKHYSDISATISFRTNIPK